MAGYSVGDRVEVLWNDGPYDATVIKVYSGGAVDVTHDANNSLGVFLTADEHGLKLLPVEKREKKEGEGGWWRRREEGVLSGTLLQQGPQEGALHPPRQEALLGRRVCHQSSGSRSVRKTRRRRKEEGVLSG